jgi:hypothetical protein
LPNGQRNKSCLLHLIPDQLNKARNSFNDVSSPFDQIISFSLTLPEVPRFAVPQNVLQLALYPILDLL